MCFNAPASLRGYDAPEEIRHAAIRAAAFLVRRGARNAALIVGPGALAFGCGVFPAGAKRNHGGGLGCLAKLGKEIPSVRYTRGTRRTGVSEDLIFQKARLAGAVGLEPTPSSLTVRCPTNWTTPQPCTNCKRYAKNPATHFSIVWISGLAEGYKTSLGALAPRYLGQQPANQIVPCFLFTHKQFFCWGFWNPRIFLVS
jgi:hypothetical protein